MKPELLWKEAQVRHSMAMLNLQFTTITYRHWTGELVVVWLDVGNIVTTDQTALATIIPLEQMYVYFDIDERTVLRLRRSEKDWRIVFAMKEAVRVNIALRGLGRVRAGWQSRLFGQPD